MTDATSSNAFKPELEAWLDAWRSCTQDVLSQISGQPTVFETIFEPLATKESDLRYTVAALGAVQGEMAFCLSETSGQRLAGKFLGETVPSSSDGGSEKEFSGESREALEELLRQIGGLVATSVGERAGGPVQFQLLRAEAPWAWTSDHVATLRTRDEAGREIALDIRISPALAAALAARAQVKEASASPAPSASVSPPSTSPGAGSGAAAPPRGTQEGPVPERVSAGYGRLRGVGLGVKLRFGTRRILLRDVLALSTGQVVELDDELSSPVDLLLDGRVIARGDVVVIDGKYGLRVTEVVDPPPGTGVSVGSAIL
jgi:flagellar motor switch protein FliN